MIRMKKSARTPIKIIKSCRKPEAIPTIAPKAADQSAFLPSDSSNLIAMSIPAETKRGEIIYVSATDPQNQTSGERHHKSDIANENAGETYRIAIRHIKTAVIAVAAIPTAIYAAFGSRKIAKNLATQTENIYPGGCGRCARILK